MTSVVVCGYMVRHPAAGNVLAFLQYVIGLERMGLDVVYVEDSGWPYSSYDPWTEEWQSYPHRGLALVRTLIDRHCARARVVYVDTETGVVDGADSAELDALFADADLVLNIGGVCYLPQFRLARRRALVDMDPFFTQVSGFASKVLHEYDAHFTYGTNVGGQGSRVPTLGLDWIPTLPPVVMALWDDAPPVRTDAAYTTVANWTGYGGVDYEGEHFGQKDMEFARLVDLPGRVSCRLELALSGAQDELAGLTRRGWSAFDARELSLDVDAYSDYIRTSRGELSAAKNAYVKSRCGWFSDRTGCYLAAGRPAIVQDTGVLTLPAGAGLVTFTDLDGAAAALNAVERDYEMHAAAARSLAADHLAHDVVLDRLLSQVGDSTVARGTRA